MTLQTHENVDKTLEEILTNKNIFRRIDKHFLALYRILVMDAGKVKEFDSPTALLADSKSIFHGMAADAGLV